MFGLTTMNGATDVADLRLKLQDYEPLPSVLEELKKRTEKMEAARTERDEAEAERNRLQREVTQRSSPDPEDYDARLQIADLQDRIEEADQRYREAGRRYLELRRDREQFILDAVKPARKEAIERMRQEVLPRYRELQQELIDTVFKTFRLEEDVKRIHTAIEQANAQLDPSDPSVQPIDVLDFPLHWRTFSGGRSNSDYWPISRQEIEQYGFEIPEQVD